MLDFVGIHKQFDCDMTSSCSKDSGTKRDGAGICEYTECIARHIRYKTAVSVSRVCE